MFTSSHTARWRAKIVRCSPRSLAIAWCAATGVLLALNLGGCADAFFPNPGLSIEDGYQSLNGFFYPPNVSAQYRNTASTQVNFPEGRCSGNCGANAVNTGGAYVGDGLYTDGVHGLNYYLGPAYYAGGFY